METTVTERSNLSASSESRQGPKLPVKTGRTEGYQPSRHALFLSVLCSFCLKAKSTRCSFCTLLLSSIRERHTENKRGAEKFYETKSRRPLIAEIQFYTDLGLSFQLWYHKKEDWHFLTSITLKFSDAEIWFGKDTL
jgi:hypothetical protein